MTVHDFQQSLARSHAYADAPWWLEVYQQAFPAMVGCHDLRHDGWHQRAGVDRMIVLRSSKALLIDEKVRERDWGDVLLEVWSDYESRAPGWIAKDLACDFIAYAFAPTRRCLLLPFHTLRAAWRQHRHDWVSEFGYKDADNGRYTTRSVAVPEATLRAAIAGAMLVTWTAEAAA